MGAPKRSLSSLFGGAQKKQDNSAEEKVAVEIYQKKIQKLLKDPKAAKKAALIIEQMLKESPKTK